MQANQEKVRQRRTYSVEFKLAAVQVSQAPGASLSGVALPRGLNANLLRRWVDEARSGTLPAAMKAFGRAAARLNGHDPYAYLKDVLTRLPTQLNSCIEELLPHRWTPAEAAA